MKLNYLSIALFVGLAGVTASSPASAEKKQGNVTIKGSKINQNGELLLQLVAASKPTGLDQKASARLDAIALRLKKNETNAALSEWEDFLRTYGKKLGKANVQASSRWLLRVSHLHSTPELLKPADRLRYAREAKSKAETGIANLKSAKAVALKSGKAASVKLLKVVPYKQFQLATSESQVSLSAEQIDAQIVSIKGQLDSLSEMGEMESLRLQMAMDRMSKMMSALSNLSKKMSDTAQSITQNLK